MDDARAGASRLNKALDGLHSLRTESTLNVVAHSYGSTTASLALSDSSVRVDTFVVIGSAGLSPDIRSVDDINADEVYAGQARNAFAVPPSQGTLGMGRPQVVRASNRSDEPSFGAHTFGTDSEGSGLNPVVNHVTSTPNGGGI